MVGFVAKDACLSCTRAVAVNSRREDFEWESALQRGDTRPRPSFQSPADETAVQAILATAIRKLRDVIDHRAVSDVEGRITFFPLQFI